MEDHFMPTTSKKVQITFPPYQIKKLREHGSEHGMQSMQGSLQNGTICMKIISFIFDLRSDIEVQKYLEKNGGTLHDLILRALKQYIT